MSQRQLECSWGIYNQIYKLYHSQYAHRESYCMSTIVICYLCRLFIQLICVVGYGFLHTGDVPMSFYSVYRRNDINTYANFTLLVSQHWIIVSFPNCNVHRNMDLRNKAFDHNKLEKDKSPSCRFLLVFFFGGGEVVDLLPRHLIYSQD